MNNEGGGKLGSLEGKAGWVLAALPSLSYFFLSSPRLADQICRITVSAHCS